MYAPTNEHTLSHDLLGWREVISNTLSVIQKMEHSLIEWDKSLEKRQILDAKYFGSNINQQENLNDNNNNNNKFKHPDDL